MTRYFGEKKTVLDVFVISEANCKRCHHFPLFNLPFSNIKLNDLPSCLDVAQDRSVMTVLNPFVTNP